MKLRDKLSPLHTYTHGQRKKLANVVGKYLIYTEMVCACISEMINIIFSKNISNSFHLMHACVKCFSANYLCICVFVFVRYVTIINFTARLRFVVAFVDYENVLI